MAHAFKTCIEDFNATYGSTTVFEARVTETSLVLDNALEDAAQEPLLAASLLHHTTRMALGFAWEYQIKHRRAWMEENLEFEITNDLFTLSFEALREGKVRFVPCEGVKIQDMWPYHRTL